LIGFSQTFRSCGVTIKQLCCCNRCDETIGNQNATTGVAAPVTTRGQSSWIRLVTLIWLCSALLSIPHSLYQRMVHYSLGHYEMIRCAPTFPSHRERRAMAI